MNITKIRPLNNQVLTTADMYVEEQYIAGTTIIDGSKTRRGLKEYQTVLAIGPMVRNINVGDLVCINPDQYANRKYAKGSMKADMEEYDNVVVSYNFPMVRLNNEDKLLITDRDIEFVVEEYEAEPAIKLEDLEPKKEIIL